MTLPSPLVADAKTFGVRTLRRRLRNRIAARPAIYLPLRRLMRPEATVGPDTELVVEGFPRSGNTYAEFALRASQPRELRIAHHSHAPAQVMGGVERGIPVILAVREPRASVLSLAAMFGNRLPVVFLLDEYIWYHRNLLPTVNCVLAVTLTDLNDRVDSVLTELNRRFGLSLEHDEATLRDLHARALALMDAYSERRFGRSMSLSNPNRDRAAEDRLKDRAQEILDSDALKDRMKTAWSLHDEILKQASL